MKVIATPSRTKEILEKHDLYAKKNYGQNFLIEPGIVSKIAAAAVTKGKCAVFEIGPGIGALTQMLSKEADKVVAFEIDERLPAVLADTLAECDNVEVVLQDFLNIDLKAVTKPYLEEGYEVVVAANLPYYITTPILFKIFEADAGISQITVMMQKEVADRFAAKCNTKDYNALSVITQYRCTVKNVLKVPKNVFNPKPNVDSAVLQFRFKENDPTINEPIFYKLVKGCFTQRRKTLLNNLSETIGDKESARKVLTDSGIDPARRAESCGLEEFISLYRSVENAGISLCKD